MYRGSDKGRFPSTERSAECHHIARTERCCKIRRHARELSWIVGTHACYAHREHEFDSVKAKNTAMFWRANDVLVGVVTGAIVAVIAAAIEAYFVTIRFITFGHHGGGVGSGIGVITIVGAVVGGLVGLILGALIKPRTTPR
jgi:hypothetical protein